MKTIDAATAAVTSKGTAFTPWIPIVSALFIGPMTNIYRVTSLYGCNELEAFGPGSAGILGNLLSPIYIIMVGLFAFCFFGELMTPLEIGGACLISSVIPIITAIKAWRKIKEEKKAEDEERPKNKGEVRKQIEYDAEQNLITNGTNKSALTRNKHTIQDESTPLLA